MWRNKGDHAGERRLDERRCLRKGGRGSEGGEGGEVREVREGSEGGEEGREGLRRESV